LIDYRIHKNSKIVGVDKINYIEWNSNLPTIENICFVSPRRPQTFKLNYTFPEKMSQNLVFLSTTLLIFLIAGCEKPPMPGPPQSNQNENDSKPPLVDVETESDPSLKAPVPKISLTEKPETLLKEPEKETIKAEPIVPSFSKELLQAVSNWKKIPKSVFPLKSIQLKEDVDLEAKTLSGKTMATSLAEKGSKVTAIGIDDGMLVVANPNNPRLRGRVELDKSDFKQMVAYLFDYRKKQREKMQSESEKPANVQQNQGKAENIEYTKEEENFIPDPLDFGHGRFCICRDCREKRLAESGTLKTGFGLEP